jgi:hypothetical protein
MGIETDLHRELYASSRTRGCKQTVTNLKGDSGNNEYGNIALKVMWVPQEVRIQTRN